ncbi:hypothetical protein GCM10011297_18210 [Bacterioplanes sanyensis]|uniref:hypothetical protein n=1 Tax=Bacterioplanes sanyensis TaxID=1249553 RepID=UPI00167A92CB|nr:hypothetical protein [Bacterioplanes sanyensis]GGY45807.1 hypothetical protein GCM10011297_18210 [Bacterioplanes sanyensis]
MIDRLSASTAWQSLNPKPIEQTQPPASKASASVDTVSLQRPNVAADIEQSAALVLPELALPTQADVDLFQQDFRRAMTKAGIDWSGKIDLTINGEGKVLVKGDHPDKSRIEALFEQDSELQQGFVKTEMVHTFRKVQQLHQQREQMLNNGASEEAANQWLVDQMMRVTAQPSTVSMVDGRVAPPDSQQYGGLAAMQQLQAKYTV